MSHNASASTITVCFWNILSDVNTPSLVQSQSDRLVDIITLLKNLPERSIIGLAEVENTSTKQIGSYLDASTVTFRDNHRENSQIGIVSKLSLEPKFVPIGKGCRAAVVEYAGINIVFVHASLVLPGDKKRRAQIKDLIRQLDHNLPTVVMGDFNSMYWQGSRSLFKQAGFTSAFKRSMFRRHPTAPTRKYRKILPPLLRTLGRFGFTLDDAYVKGLEVIESRMFEGESDHKGLVVKVRLS